MASRIACWWLSVWPPGTAFVVTLAPTGHQVRAQLWREIGRIHKAAALPGRTNQTEWFIGDELVGFGRSPKDTDPTAVQGQHADRMLVILDEACGIAKALCDAVDTLITNDNCRILAIGNPDDPNTEFGAMCRPGSGWNNIKISAFDTPNFTGEAVPEWLRGLLISKVWVEEKKKSWGIDSPIYKSKILGEFPEQSADSLVPLAALRAATTRELPEGPENELGFDISRFGDDSTVLYHRLGPVARRIYKGAKKDTMFSAGVAVRAIHETGAKVIRIDDIGLGGGVTDRLKELQNEGKIPYDVQIIGVNVGEGTLEEEIADERFRNLRAKVNWDLRGRFIDGNIVLLGETDDLLSQAAQIKYEFTSSGLIQIEKKEKMKKRLKGVSPDDWDALVLCFAQTQTDLVALYAKLGA